MNASMNELGAAILTHAATTQHQEKGEIFAEKSPYASRLAYCNLSREGHAVRRQLKLKSLV